MVAYNLVNYLGKRDDAESIFNYAAGGFYDFTRIASSDPTMWADICVANKDEIINSINGFIDCLRRFKTKDFCSKIKMQFMHYLIKQSSYVIKT